MGKVKELWQEQQEKEFRKRVDAYVIQGIDPDEAMNIVADEMSQEAERDYGPE